MALTPAEKQRRYRARKKARASVERAEAVAAKAGRPLVSALADAVAAWAEARLKVPVGLRAGQPFRLLPFQRSFLADALAPGVRTACLSTARKNGKSGLVAAIILAALLDDGPLHRARWRGLAVSLNARLSGELWGQCREIAAASGISTLTFHGGAHRAIVGANEARVEFLATGRSAGHASGADLALFDELGLTSDRDRALLDGLRSSVSAREGGRLLAISVRGRSPLLDEMRERAEAGEPGVVFHLHAADPGAALDDRAAWKAGNPALGELKEESYMATAAREAQAAPGSAPGFRALDLNQSVAPDEVPLLDLDTWRRCVVVEAPPATGEAVIGLDLGANASMTAAAVFYPSTGRFEAHGLFPGIPTLAERAERDAVGSLYQQMVDRGELEIAPGVRVPPVGVWLAGLMTRAQADGARVVAVIADRYRQSEAKDALGGVPGIQQVRVVFRGTGAHAKADGSADVRAFQAECAEGRLKARSSVLMTAALRGSRLRFDEGGNPALDKREQRGRIDAASAAVLAVGYGRSLRLRGVAPIRYHGAARGAMEALV